MEGGELMVTWGMVGRVALFGELNAGEIADIMRLMRAQTFEPGDAIVRRGDVAHSMYFVAAGEVEIELRDGRIRLGVGHFFGEMAVLRQSRRSATVTAVTRASLLVLDAHDLHALMEREPRVAERMHDVMRQRLGGGSNTPQGELPAQGLAGGGQAPALRTPVGK